MFHSFMGFNVLKTMLYKFILHILYFLFLLYIIKNVHFGTVQCTADLDLSYDMSIECSMLTEQYNRNLSSTALWVHQTSVTSTKKPLKFQKI